VETAAQRKAAKTVPSQPLGSKGTTGEPPAARNSETVLETVRWCAEKTLRDIERK